MAEDRTISELEKRAIDHYSILLFRRDDALSLLEAKSGISQFLGFDGFHRLDEKSFQIDSHYCYDMNEAIVSADDLAIISEGRTRYEGRLLMAKKIISEAPEDLYLEMIFSS